MKRLILSILAAWPLLAAAQLSSVVPTLGPSVANFKDQPGSASSSGDKDPNVGFAGGIRLDLDMSTPFLKVSPELFFQQKGSKHQYLTSASQLLERSINLDYLGMFLPITIFIPTGEDDESVGIVMQGKFFADYALSGTLKDSSGEDDIQFTGNGDRFDLGYGVEFGFRFLAGEDVPLQLSFGYNWGLKNIEFAGDLQASQEYLVNNRGFTLSIGAVLATENGDY